MVVRLVVSLFCLSVCCSPRFFWLIECMVVCMMCWLIGWLFAWLVGWLFGWVVAWSRERFFVCMAKCSIAGLVEQFVWLFP